VRHENTIEKNQTQTSICNFDGRAREYRISKRRNQNCFEVARPIMEIETYLKEKGWEYKRARNQFCLRICPICGDSKFHFYISEDGAWTCHKCQGKGNLYQLKKQLGDITDRNHEVRPVSDVMGKSEEPKPLDISEYLKCHDALLANPGTMTYLTQERGFNDETITHFKLGLKKEDRTNWLMIPHFSAGKLINVKHRSLPPADKKFKREPDRPSILFNQDCLKNGFEEIFLCESETDAMSLWGAGFKNVLASTCGAGSFLPEWHQTLEGIEEIYLCYDPDEAGQKGAHAIADRLGFERCKNILLPEGQDLNEFLKTHTRDDFLKLALQAKRFTVPDVLSTRDIFRRFDERRKYKPDDHGIVTEWPNFNKKIASFMPGHLIILCAIWKIGKTSFALNIAHYNATLGKPIFFYCLEMSPFDLLLKLCSLHLDRPIESLALLSEKERDDIANLPIYFGEARGLVDSKYVFDRIRSTVKRYDIELVIFDNLHYLVREIRYAAQEIGIATKGFKMLGEQLRVPILLICQPRKIPDGQIPTLMDLKDSSAIAADADQIIVLHRRALKSDQGDGMVREELETSFAPETLVRIEASRYHAGGDTMLYFDGAKSKFRKID